MNNDDFKEVPDNIQDNNEETTNNIDNTNDNKSNDYEDVCYICRRPESVAGKMIHIQPNLCICNDCMQKTFDSMSNGNFGNFGNLGNISNMDFGNMPNISMINLSDLTGGIPNSQKLKKKKPKEEKKVEPILDIHSIPAPHRIKASLDDYVVGQEHAKKVMSVAVYNHYKRVMADNKHKAEEEKTTAKQSSKSFDGVEIEKSNMLMIGPTGSGKTYLVKTLAKLLDVPLAITDATSLTEAGYIGDDIESVVSKLLAAADNDVERAEHGIIFIDEIDKLAKKRNANQRDVSGESVQQGMLKLLEGSEVEVPVGASSKNAMVPMTTVDTRNILFICGGAFDGLEKIIEKRTDRKGIGFDAVVESKAERQTGALLKEVQPHDLLKFGIIPELVGRLPVIAALDGLTRADLVQILTKPKNALVKQYQKLFSYDNVDLTFTEDALEAVADKAIARNIGARGLRAVMEGILTNVMFDIPSDPTIERVTITADCVEGKSQPQILHDETNVPHKAKRKTGKADDLSAPAS